MAMENLDAATAAEAPIAAKRAAATAVAREKLAELAVKGELTSADAAPLNSGMRAFVAPVERNTRFLVKAGEIQRVRDAGVAQGERMTSREGDVFVEFVEGLTVLDPNDSDDVLRIKWCEANDAICRDIADPFTEAWAYMKELQTETASAERRLPQGVDLEKIMRGDPSGQIPHDAVDRGRKRVATGN